MGYIVGVLLAVMVAMGGAFSWYYSDTQERIGVLQENNAKLEVAVQTSEESVKTLQNDMVKLAEANATLQSNLQKAEAYGDDLRSKLSRHNLTAQALKEPDKLEGKMNGATAKLWRGLEKDSGGAGDAPLPTWLQSDSVEQTGTGNQSSNQGGEVVDTNGSKTEASPAN